MNDRGLDPVLVDVLSPEAQALRPNCRGMDGPHLIETELANGLWALPPF